MNAAGLVVLERLGVSLLHSLWQGALVGLLLFVGLVVLRRSAAQVRYLLSCAALALMLLLPVCTFVQVQQQITVASSVPSESRLVASAATALEAAATLLPAEAPLPPLGAALPEGETQDPFAAASELSVIQPKRAATNGRRWLSAHAEALLLAMVAGWAIGVMLLSCRVMGGYLVAWGLTRRLVGPVHDVWQVRFKQLAARLGVRMPIELWQSACVDVPIVIGCLRPMVLVPIGILAELPISQVEAILAHELAHIRRYDYFVNALQCAIETLLFYHPCAWWISARIRAEREHCCDTIAVAACGDALNYARALTGLEERRSPARLALALTGGGFLLARVRRIVGQRRISDIVGGWLAGALAIALPLAVGGAWAWGRAAGDDPRRLDTVDADTAHDASYLVDLARHEAPFRNAVQITNDLAETLSAINDATSAAAVAEQIVPLARRHAEVDRRLREVRRSIPPEMEAYLARRWATQIEAAAEKLRTEVARLAQVPGAVDALRSSVLFELIGLHGNRDTAGTPDRTVDVIAESWPRHGRFAGPRGDPLQRMLEEHGPQYVVKVIVTGLPGEVYNEVYEHLRQILPNLGYFGSGNGDIATVYLAPISDLDFFASRIDLGDISSIDRQDRVITVVADHARLPRQGRRQPTTKVEDDDAELDSTDPIVLCERLAMHDRRAIASLIELGPPAETAVTELVAHEDGRVRRDALLVLKRIATEASLPMVVAALADAELGNRDLAWQTICRLPGAFRRQDVMDAAGAGLERDSEQASKWLTAIGPAAEEVVLPYARHDEAGVRRQAARVLGKIGTAKSLSALEQLFGDLEASVAAAAHTARDLVATRHAEE